MNEQELFYHLKHNLETLYERIDRQNMSQSEYEAHQAHISNLELVLEVLEHRDGDNKLEVTGVREGFVEIRAYAQSPKNIPH